MQTVTSNQEHKPHKRILNNMPNMVNMLKITQKERKHNSQVDHLSISKEYTEMRTKLQRPSTLK